MEQQQAEQTPYETTKIRIYGIPVQRIHNPNLGPLVEENERYPFHGIVYCGFKTVYNEVRQPTERLWYFGKEKVENTGEVEDFEWDGQRVNYYDIDLTTVIYEKHYQEVDLDAETVAKFATFARRVAVQPESNVDIESIRSMTREQLEQFVAGLIEGQAVAVPAGVLSERGQIEVIARRKTSTLRQTYNETRYDPWLRRDPWGGDMDLHTP